MEKLKQPSPIATDEDEPSLEVHKLILSLPKDTIIGASLYQNFWYMYPFVPNVISFQRHFEAHDEDIIVASQPKSGTTWLKALVFSIVNRTRFPPSMSPLLNSNPHELVPFFEIQLYLGEHIPDLKDIPKPRLFGTHIPYASLPESIKSSKCRLVYICRNPLDAVVSYWQFASKFRNDRNLETSMDEYAESFSRGVSSYGPYWDHVLNYWNESLENPNKVLFLKYEDMKENTIFHVQRMAKFLGCPFSPEEEKNGVIEEIIHLCSFNKMKNLSVNQDGELYSGVHFNNNTLFRKGEVGDFSNYLSPSRVESIKSIVKEKFTGSGLNVMP